MRIDLYTSVSGLVGGLRARLAALAVVLLLAPAAWAQVEVPAGNPNGTGSGTARKPLGTFFGYERSAMIYTAAEIATTGSLTRVGFYVSSASVPGAAPTKIYLKTVANATFAAPTTVAAEETGATLVYEGTIPAASFTANTWVSVPLTTPFAYDGTSNLEVIVETNATGEGNEASTGKAFRYASTGTGNNRAQFWNADNTAPAVAGTLSLFRPNIQLTGLAPLACPPVSTLTIDNFTATTAQVSFTPGAGNNSYTVAYTPAGGATTTITPAPTASPVTLTGLTVGVLYTVTVTSNCAGSATSLVATTTFVQPPPNDNPSGAIALLLSAGCTPVNGTNAGATTTTPNGYANPGAAPNSCGIAASPRDVWYSFTTAASGAGSTAASVQVTGNPAGYIRVFSSTTGAAGPFTELACASGGAINTVSNALNLTGLTPNATYYVFVAGYGSSDTAGPFTICVSSTAAIICAAPTAVAVSGITTTSASLAFTPSVGNTGYTVTYYPTATPASVITVTPAPTASPVALTGLTAGTAYTVTLQALCSAGGTTPLITRTFTTRALPPANDECTAATTLTPGAPGACATTSGTVAGATQTSAPILCNGFTAAAAQDVWYSFTATATAHAINVVGNFDGVLEVLSGACGALTNVACADADSNNETLDLTGLTVGTTYRVRYYPYSSNPTNPAFTICITTLPPNDAAVQVIYTVGKAPVSAPRVVQAVIRNAGAAALTNVPVTLSVTGATTFADAKIIPALAVGASAIVTFASYTPTTTGNNTLTVTLQPDGLNTNNTQTYAQTVTANSLSYLNDGQPVTASIGVDATAPGGTLAVKYGISSSATISEVKLNFLANPTTTSTYQVVVLNATTGNLPNAVVFTSPTLNRPTAASVVTVPVTGVTVNGTFFVGLKEVSGSVGIGYQVEDPLREATFYYQVSGAGPWIDVNTTPLRTRLGIEVTFGSRILATNSPALSRAISLFPNPSSGQVTLEIRDAKATGALQVEITNTLGQVVHTAALRDNTKNQLHLSGLANGLYVLRVKSGSDYTIRQLVLTK